MSKEQEANHSDLKKLLGEPVICEFSQNILKVRTTLFFFSVISIAVTIGGLKINDASSFLGLKFDGLTPDYFSKVMFFVVLYTLVHFLLGSIECFMEWRLRITGTKVAFVTTGRMANKEADYPNDPRQSTLYNWWAERVSEMSRGTDELTMILKNQAEISEELSQYRINAIDMSVFNGHMTNLDAHYNKILSIIKSHEAVINSARIPVSLQRFDNWFQYFLRIQNFRWLLIDFVLPIFLGLTALYLLSF